MDDAIDLLQQFLKERNLSFQDRVPQLKTRPTDGHKGTFGHALIIAGSEGMTGAAILAGRSALRSGAGLVSVMTVPASRDAIVIAEPALMTRAIPQPQELTEAWGESLAGYSAIGIGPGLGTSQQAQKLVATLYQHFPGPMVIDADGLNGLSQHQPSVWSEHSAEQVRIVTPHPGEFARMIGCATSDLASPLERWKSAVEFASTHRVIVCLKGQQTVMTDGSQFAINRTGNSGLATGGTGDVLTGLMTGLLAQREQPLDAVRLACHLHGFAADLAVEELTPWGMTSTDLVEWLPAAFKTHGLRLSGTEN